MAIIQWPDKLGGPKLAGYSREEVVGFRDSELAAGPAFVEIFSDDTPQFHNVQYLFKQDAARRFERWLRTNKVKSESPWFDGPIPTPDRSVKTQECRFTADGYPQFTGISDGGVYSYSARLLTREIVNNDDEYGDVFDIMFDLSCGNVNWGVSKLDEGICHNATN